MDKADIFVTATGNVDEATYRSYEKMKDRSIVGGWSLRFKIQIGAFLKTIWDINLTSWNEIEF